MGVATDNSEWSILPHDEIEEVSDNIWCVEGTLPHMSLKRRMTVVRMQDERLLVHSAVALDEEAMARIEAWGRPAFLVVPGAWHRLDAAAYKRRYPQLAVYCPSGARRAVEKVVAVDGTYGEFPELLGVSLRVVDGTGRREGVLRVRSGDDETLVFNDLIFNQEHMPGVGGLIMRALGSTGGPRVTPLARMLLMRNRRALKEDLIRLSTVPDLHRIIVSHGALIEWRASQVLNGIAHTL